MNTYQHILLLQKLFKHLGISEDRIQQYFCSAADVEKFVSSVEDITKKIALLPPLPRKVKSELG
jgi:coenzyme F420-reducing hydrogenase delta subunit